MDAVVAVPRKGFPCAYQAGTAFSLCYGRQACGSEGQSHYTEPHAASPIPILVFSITDPVQPRLFSATALPDPSSLVCCLGSPGNACRLAPSLPWTTRVNVRTASPAALWTLQLYRPLSDTWDRKNTW